MTAQANGFSISRFTPKQQGIETHADGNVTEFKSISFPQEFGGTTSIGPLFYWSWVSAGDDGKVCLNPHQGFEIFTYSLKGEVRHTDSLGNGRQTSEGGAQLLQSGSGINFQEKTLSRQSEFLQIWFEPDFRKAMNLTPAFSDYLAADFPVSESGCVNLKTLIGPRSPVQIKAEASMHDIVIDSGGAYSLDLRHGRVLAALTLRGSGIWKGVLDIPVEKGDFVVLQNEEQFEIDAGVNGIRFVIAEIPREVSYPLYSGH